MSKTTEQVASGALPSWRPWRLGVLGDSDRSRRRRALRHFVGDRLAMLGLLLLVLLVGLAVAAPLVAPADPTRVNPRERLQGPSTSHPVGTDELGRDLLSRLIYGARASFSVGVVAVAIALVVGVLLGLLGGFYGGA